MSVSRLTCATRTDVISLLLVNFNDLTFFLWWMKIIIFILRGFIMFMDTCHMHLQLSFLSRTVRAQNALESCVFMNFIDMLHEIFFHWGLVSAVGTFKLFLVLQKYVLYKICSISCLVRTLFTLEIFQSTCKIIKILIVYYSFS